jgi:hypothetical protein
MLRSEKKFASETLVNTTIIKKCEKKLLIIETLCIYLHITFKQTL